MMMKRSHAATLASAPITNTDHTIDAAAAGAKLTHSLSKSLHELLLNNSSHGADNDNENGETNATHSSQTDVYHHFLNSPPKNYSSPSQKANAWKRHVNAWLASAMTTVGVGSSVNTLKFWKEYGREKEEEYMDGRYLVWFVKEILVGFAGGVFTSNDGNGADEEEEYFGDALMVMMEQWHLSIIDLLNKNGVQHPGEDDPNNIAEDMEGDAAAGVMWQMLLQNAHLSPDSLRDAFEGYVSPQESYEQQSPLENIDEDIALPAEYFSWPSFFRTTTLEAAEAHSAEHGSGNSNKRRRSNNSKALPLINIAGTKNKNWYPLLGYAITHAFLSSSDYNSKMTTRQKIQYLKENILTSLPDMLNIANYDFDTKNSLLGGVLACVMDEMGEWIVLDGLALGETSNVEGDDGIVSASGEEEARMNEEVCERMRASVGRIVDLYLSDGILPKLAKLTQTPPANLVAEAADTLLNYSEVHHKLRNRNKSSLFHNDLEEENSGSCLQENLANDAKQIVNLIEAANPQLKAQLSTQKFHPNQFMSSNIATGHPLAIYTRAILATQNLPAASKVCKNLEDSTGIEEITKRCCYFLLYEKMQDLEVLFEDGWNTADTTVGGGATLANITAGPLGKECALEYLENVVVEAKEMLMPSSVTPAIHSRQQRRAYQEENEAKLHEVLCVKDIVRRTILKFLSPRAYSPHEALSLATDLSDARSKPELEYTVWGMENGKNHGAAVDVACKILAQRSLYSVYNESLDAAAEEEEEEEVFEEDELLDVERREEQEVHLDDATMEAVGTATLRMHREEDASRAATAVLAGEKNSADAPAPAAKGSYFDEDLGVEVECDLAMEALERADEYRYAAAAIGNTEEELRVEQQEEEEEEVIELGDDSEEEDVGRATAGAVAAAMESPVEEEEEVASEDEDDDDETKSLESEEHKAAIIAATAATMMGANDDDDETKSVESIEENEEEKAANVAAMQEGAEEEAARLRAHRNQYPGNYSESDDYSGEDEDEETRHLAFEGDYDEEEGRGESDYEVAGRQEEEGGECLIEILDSSDEDDDEEDEQEREEEEQMYEDDNSAMIQDESSEEENETKILNDKVDRYIGVDEEEAGDVNESEEEQRQEDVEARILKEDVHEYTLVGDVGAAGDGKEEEEAEAEEVNIGETAAVERHDQDDQIPEESDVHESDLASLDAEAIAEEDRIASAGDAYSSVDDEERDVPEEASSRVDENIPEGPIDVDETFDTAREEDGPASPTNADAELHESDDDDEVVEVIDMEEATTAAATSLEVDEEVEVDYEGEESDEDEVIVQEQPVVEEQDADGKSEEAIQVDVNPGAASGSAQDDAVVEESVEEQVANEPVDAEAPVPGDVHDVDKAEDAQYPLAATHEHGNEIPTEEEEGDSDTDDMQADDEHESIDTEDDKRSLATAEEEEADASGPEEGVPPSFEESIPTHGTDGGKQGEEQQGQESEEERPSVLVAAAMSSQCQGNNFDQSSIELPAERIIAGDNQSFDNTSAALASTDANLWENYDDASQGGGDTSIDGDRSTNVRVVARYHGQDLALDSVVDVHADADDTAEGSSQEDTTDVKEEGDGQITDPGYLPDDADVTEEERPVRAKKAIDDGYLPDAEATEEEQQMKPRKPVIDAGYVPDASEASEVDAPNSDRKRAVAAKAAAAIVRFETELETRIGHHEAAVTLPPPPNVNASQSIDEGYLPTDNDEVLTEEEHHVSAANAALALSAPSIDEGYIPSDTGEVIETHRRQGIDEGYLPDGHTTPGEATEEDNSQGEEAVASREETAAIALKEDDVEEVQGETAASAAAATPGPRLDDIDHGYLPSAVEGTEEELSEKEDLTTDRKNVPVHSSGDQSAAVEPSSPIAAGGGDAMPSVLVATATALQQQGTPQGSGSLSDQAGTLQMKDASLQEDEGDKEGKEASMGDDYDVGEVKMGDDLPMDQQEEEGNKLKHDEAENQYAFDGEVDNKDEEAAKSTDMEMEPSSAATPAAVATEEAVMADVQPSKDEEASKSVGNKKEDESDVKDGDAAVAMEEQEAEVGKSTTEAPPSSSPTKVVPKEVVLLEKVAVVASPPPKQEMDANANEVVDAAGTENEEIKVEDQPTEAKTAAAKVGKEEEVEMAEQPTVAKTAAPDQAIDDKREEEVKVEVDIEEEVKMTEEQLAAVNTLEEVGKEEDVKEHSAVQSAAHVQADNMNKEEVTAKAPKQEEDTADNAKKIPGVNTVEDDAIKADATTEDSKEGKAEEDANKTDVATEDNKEGKVVEAGDETAAAQTSVAGTKTDDVAADKDVLNSAVAAAAAAQTSSNATKTDDFEANKDELKPAAAAAAKDNTGADGSDDEQQEAEDFSKLKVVALKDRLRELNLHVSGRKQELINRLTEHLYPNLKPSAMSAEDDESFVSKSSMIAASKTSSRRKKAPSASAGSKKRKTSAETPSKSSPSRKSKREKKLSPKAAQLKQEHDTPISELSHPATVNAARDSDFEDDSVQEQHFAGKSPGGVPTSIVTTRKRGRGGKQSVLPAVPEGEVVVGSTVDDTLGTGTGGAEEEEAEGEASITRLTQSKRSTRRTAKNNDDLSVASDDTSVVSRTRRRASKRSAEDDDDDASRALETAKRSRRSTRAAASSKGADESEAEEESSTRGGLGRNAAIASKKKTKDDDVEEKKEPPKKRRPGRPKKNVEEESVSVASSLKRSARGLARTTKKADEESVSTVGTRRTTRSRAKK